MNSDEKKTIKELTHQRMNATNVSQNNAAKQIGISSGTLSQLLNDKWELISSDMWRKVAAWVGHTTKSWKIRETKNLLTIQNLCKDAQQNSRFLAVIGATGYGKTTPLKLYAAQTQNAFYNLCTVVMGQKSFLTTLQQSIGIDADGSVEMRIRTIINKLKVLENPVIILDDAGKLKDACYRLLQIIYDELEGRCGIVIAGVPYLKNYIFKMAAKDKQGFRELKRRIGFWQELAGPSGALIRTICADYGITDTDALKYVERNCQNLGSLREMLTNWTMAPKDGFTQWEIITNLAVGYREMEVA
jgi:DNA transposition AAA+ family ATPase